MQFVTEASKKNTARIVKTMKEMPDSVEIHF